MCVYIDLITLTNSSIKAKLNIITQYKNFSRFSWLKYRKVKAQISESVCSLCQGIGNRAMETLHGGVAKDKWVLLSSNFLYILTNLKKWEGTLFLKSST